MVARPRASRLAVTATCLAMAAGFATAPAAYADPTPEFSVDDIAPPTGMAADPDGDVIWFGGGSGPGQITGVAADGSKRDAVSFGARTIDVQALAADDGRILVGDIGDEGGDRDIVTVYSVNPTTTGPNYWAFDFAYPDTPRDARAMFVRDGRISLVTRGDDPGIYSTTVEPTRQGVNQLTRIADAPAGVTDAVALSGGRVALRTYTAVLVADSAGVIEGAAPLPWQDAGEAMAADGDELLLADSASPVAVLREAVPTEQAEVPAGPDTPPPSPSAGDTPTPTAAPPNPPVAGPSLPGPDRVGTMIAIGLAALVAVIAAIVVQLAPRPRRAAPRPRITLTEDDPPAPSSEWARPPDQRAD